MQESGWPGCSSRDAMSAAAESSGCMRMKDMASLDQSDLMKVGKELS